MANFKRVINQQSQTVETVTEQNVVLENEERVHVEGIAKETLAIVLFIGKSLND